MQAPIPAAPLLILIPTNAPGEAAKDGPRTWSLAPMGETQMELQLPAFDVVQPHLGSEPMDGGPLYLSLLLSPALPFN